MIPHHQPLRARRATRHRLLVAMAATGASLCIFSGAVQAVHADAGGALRMPLDFLLQPISGSATHRIDSAIAWHGRVMVVAWGIMLPLGALAARFFKVTPRQHWPEQLDNKAWWRSHLWLQGGGLLFSIAGLCLALWQAGSASPAARLHAVLGWAVMTAGLVQVVLGYVRGSKGGPTGTGAVAAAPQTWRGDHYDMTLRRRLFERIHKPLGWGAVALSVPTILMGLWTADAQRWMWIALALWWTGLLAAFCAWQRRGLCVDTYQAIWGPDPAHPGNRVPAIGWGIRRPPSETHQPSDCAQQLLPATPPTK